MFSVVVTLLCVGNVCLHDADTPNVNTVLNGFQFVAIIHDIVIGVSFSSMALFHLLHELRVRKGVPISHLLSPFQLSSVLAVGNLVFWGREFSRGQTSRVHFSPWAFAWSRCFRLYWIHHLLSWSYHSPVGRSMHRLLAALMGTHTSTTHCSMPTAKAWMFGRRLWGMTWFPSIMQLLVTLLSWLKSVHSPTWVILRVGSQTTAASTQTRTSRLSLIQTKFDILSAPPQDIHLSGYSAASTATEHIARDFVYIWTIHAFKTRQFRLRESKLPGYLCCQQAWVIPSWGCWYRLTVVIQ